MNYNWDGDVIIQESAIDEKRYVIGCKKPITTDIREFVSPADDAVIKRILDELVKRKKLPISKQPGDFDKRAMIVWDHVARGVKYDNDAKMERKADFWLFPSEVHTLGVGDCEDGSFLLASLLIGSGISPFNVRVALGELFDKAGNSLGGHCWPMYKNEAGLWCILESTFDRAPWGLPTIDRFAGTDELRYVPHFCFNNHHLWAIRHEEQQKPRLGNYLDGKSRRGKLANMKDPRFPSGGFLSAIAGDNSPGHLELTGDALKPFGFSEDAISVAADAAQDPDLYEWYTPAAHAQTDCHVGTGATKQSNGEAIACFLSWFKDINGKFLSADGDMHALFFLGYLLHGVQDLASHQGLTNAQHIYESAVLKKGGDDCDHLEVNREKARDYAVMLLERLKSKNAALFKRLSGYDAGFSFLAPKVAKEDKCRLLGKPGWDFTIPAYLEYKGLAEKYEAVKKANPVELWDRDKVFNRLLRAV
jgi:hypothetical protein